MSAKSGFTRSHNALANKISSDRTSYYIDGLMHSIFAENFNLSQVKDSRAPKSIPYIVTLRKI